MGGRGRTWAGLGRAGAGPARRGGACRRAGYIAGHARRGGDGRGRGARAGIVHAGTEPPAPLLLPSPPPPLPAAEGLVREVARARGRPPPRQVRGGRGRARGMRPRAGTSAPPAQVPGGPAASGREPLEGACARPHPDEGWRRHLAPGPRTMRPRGARGGRPPRCAGPGPGEPRRAPDAGLPGPGVRRRSARGAGARPGRPRFRGPDFALQEPWPPADPSRRATKAPRPPAGWQPEMENGRGGDA